VVQTEKILIGTGKFGFPEEDPRQSHGVTIGD